MDFRNETPFSYRGDILDREAYIRQRGIDIAVAG